ncbi:hypothetical protein [Sphingopyxis sp.]|jgi:hypothetical protein|uniref:hypothetical protein n=1 Tax=Sphingopyxis sp. TaxID=1908224 RepID=UPI002DF39A65|nr:hypothetical protein [Sphingopyxis sp.]
MTIALLWISHPKNIERPSTVFISDRFEAVDALLLALPIVIMTATIAHAEGSNGNAVDSRVDIGGRSIHLMCRGTGTPTVVGDAGMGTAPVEVRGAS